ALQVGGEIARHGVELAVGDRLVHADERLAIAIFGKALLQERDQRGVLRDVDLGRHAGRIVLQPDAVHASPPWRPCRPTWRHCDVVAPFVTSAGARPAASLRRRGAQTNCIRNSRPTILAARWRLSMVALPFSGSSRRSTCARLVFISCAMRCFVILFFFISAANCCAITALIAAAVTSSRIPASSSQLSKLDPRCGFVRTMIASPSFAAARAQARREVFSAFS